jgi:hypothetical protein
MKKLHHVLSTVLDQVFTWSSAFGCGEVQQVSMEGWEVIFRTRCGKDIQHLHLHTTAELSPGDTTQINGG